MQSDSVAIEEDEDRIEHKLQVSETEVDADASGMSMSMSMSNFFQEEGPAAQFNEPSKKPIKVPLQVTPLKLSSQEGDGDDDEETTDREETAKTEEPEKMGDRSDSSDEEDDDDDDDDNTRRTSRASGTHTNNSSRNSAENSFNEKHLDRERGNSFRPLSSQFRPGSSLRPGSSMRPMSKVRITSASTSALFAFAVLTRTLVAGRFLQKGVSHSWTAPEDPLDGSASANSRGRVKLRCHRPGYSAARFRG